jgi:hypothetical protein
MRGQGLDVWPVTRIFGRDLNAYLGHRHSATLQMRSRPRILGPIWMLIMPGPRTSGRGGLRAPGA